MHPAGQHKRHHAVWCQTTARAARESNLRLPSISTALSFAVSADYFNFDRPVGLVRPWSPLRTTRSMPQHERKLLYQQCPEICWAMPDTELKNWSNLCRDFHIEELQLCDKLTIYDDPEL